MWANSPPPFQRGIWLTWFLLDSPGKYVLKTAGQLQAWTFHNAEFLFQCRTFHVSIYYPPWPLFEGVARKPKFIQWPSWSLKKLTLYRELIRYYSIHRWLNYFLRTFYFLLCYCFLLSLLQCLETMFYLPHLSSSEALQSPHAPVSPVLSGLTEFRVLECGWPRT